MTRVPPQPIKRETMTAEELADHRKRMKKLAPQQASRPMPRMGLKEMVTALPVENDVDVDLYGDGE